MTTPHNRQRHSEGGVRDGVVLRIATCPGPDCPVPAGVYAEVTHGSTDGPVRHARTFCVNRHFNPLPVEYIPGMPADRRQP
jgi:hypothetical protein